LSFGQNARKKSLNYYRFAPVINHAVVDMCLRKVLVKTAEQMKSAEEEKDDAHDDDDEDDDFIESMEKWLTALTIQLEASGLSPLLYRLRNR